MDDGLASRTLLSVPDEHPFALASDDVPYAHRAVVASRDQETTACGEGADSVVVAFQM